MIGKVNTKLPCQYVVLSLIAVTIFLGIYTLMFLLCFAYMNYSFVILFWYHMMMLEQTCME